MKKVLAILLCGLSLMVVVAQGQTNKTSATRKLPKKVAAKKTEAIKKQDNAVSSKAVKNKADQSNYNTAIGIKFLYGIAITGKHFLTEKHAIEAIVRYNGLGGLGSDVNLTALYEYHGNINSLPGLRWYVGGGAYVGTFSFKDSNFVPQADNTTNLYFGLSGILGLEYKIKSLPVAISADWQPIFLLKDYYNNTGFGAENGGIGIKYTF